MSSDFGEQAQTEVGGQIAILFMRMSSMEVRQQTFEEMMSSYLSQLTMQLMDMTMSYAGNAMAMMVLGVPYIGPLLAPIVNMLVTEAPRIIINIYNGLAL